MWNNKNLSVPGPKTWPVMYAGKYGSIKVGQQK
jgi:hypothetical protein